MSWFKKQESVYIVINRPGYRSHRRHFKADVHFAYGHVYADVNGEIGELGPGGRFHEAPTDWYVWKPLTPGTHEYYHILEPR